MSARVIPFPQRAPFAVRVEREGPAWLVICRNHGWLHADHCDAVNQATAIARGFGVVVSHSPQFCMNSRKRIRQRSVQTRPHYPHRNWQQRKPTMTTTIED